MVDKFLKFLERGVVYIIEGQRTGQSVMNAYRDLVEPWEKFGATMVITESGNVLPDVWEISGDSEDITLWMDTAARKFE